MKFGEMSFARGAQFIVILSAIGAFITTTGCSFVASSKSSSKIISSPFTSSSKSFKGEETAYQEQAAGYSQAFVEVGGSGNDVFQRGLSDMAARLGVSDWESHPATWTGVGRGLGQAQISGGEMAAYAASWSGGDTEIMDLLLQGFAETR
jgi:hypothetical protein